MKKKLTNNIGIKILSVMLAFLIWIVIVNIDDPVISRTFTVDVQVLNEDVVTDIGKVYTVVEGSVVDVTVKGNKSFVDSLKSDNIIATADMKYLSKTGSVTIDVECNKYTTTKYSLELGDTKNMVVALEDITQKRLPVKFNIVGQVPDGYFVSTSQMKARPGTITVTGGKSVINKLDSIVVDVNVSKMTKDFVVTATPKAYDNNHDVMNAESLKLEFDVDTVEVSVPVYNTKTIPVNIEIKGEPAYGYYYLDTVYEPKEITIAGYAKDLSKIDSINHTIDITNKAQPLDITLELTDDLLPKGVIYTESELQIPITITIEKLATKELTINSSDILVRLPSEITTYNFVDPSKQYHIRVLAPADKINDITLDKLRPTIDLTNRTFGTYKVDLEFSHDYTVEYIGESKVEVTLSDPNASPSPSPSHSPDADTLGREEEDGRETGGAPTNSPSPQASSGTTDS